MFACIEHTPKPGEFAIVRSWGSSSSAAPPPVAIPDPIQPSALSDFDAAPPQVEFILSHVPTADTTPPQVELPIPHVQTADSAPLPVELPISHVRTADSAPPPVEFPILHSVRKSSRIRTIPERLLF